MSTNSTQRFSNRVGNYVKYRPSYPSELLQFFINELHLRKESLIADIGSGTGISAEIFLKNGNPVFGIEPNARMREAAEQTLSMYEKFKSVEGTSDATQLADHSIDFIIAAQAFHWFEPIATQKEFRRILKADGFAALIWNDRRLKGDDFHEEYENLHLKYGTDYKTVRHNNIDHAHIQSFLGPHKEFVAHNYQDLDFDSLLGRLASSSYMPSEDAPQFVDMKEDLQKIFDKYQKQGLVRIDYDTRVFYSNMK